MAGTESPNDDLGRRRAEPFLIPPPDDRISNLPDDILHLVLSNLTLKEAIRTSVLSPRWRNCWCTNPFISLSFPLKLLQNPDTYSSIVDSCLKACDSTKRINSMSFGITRFGQCGNESTAVYHRWIDFAGEKSIKSLSIFFQEHMQLSSRIFSLSSLSSLHLDMCEIPALPSDYLNTKPAFLNLESLSLQFVFLSNDSLSGFISNSPILKNLKISVSGSEENIIISSPALETLDLYQSPLVFNCRVEILEVPKLRDLVLCCDLENVVLTGLKDSPQLDEISIFSNYEIEFKERQSWVKLVSCIRGAKSLIVDYWLLEHDLGDFGSSLFLNLSYLEICGGPFANIWYPAVVGLLQQCPLLEKLNFRHNPFYVLDIESIHECDHTYNPDDYDFENDDIIRQFKGCTNIAQNLKTMEISGHHGFINLIKLMFFISSHADKLEKVDIYPKEEWVKDEGEYIAKTRRGFNKLLDFKWISSEVKINIDH